MSYHMGHPSRKWLRDCREELNLVDDYPDVAGRTDWWRVVAESRGSEQGWNRAGRERRWQPIYGQQKLRWEIAFVYLLAWALCVVAGRADDAMRRMRKCG